VTRAQFLDLVDWVINGGESGNGKRPLNCDWARLIRDDCKERVPFFFKQIDKKQTIPDDLMIREFPRQEWFIQKSSAD
jgi:protein gp37